MLAIHLDHARAWVNEAEAKISAFSTGKASPEEARVVARALQSNFHTSALADVGRILPNFRSLKDALAVSPTFECMAECAIDKQRGVVPPAYTWGCFAWERRLRSIYVCPTWFGDPVFRSRVMTLIHERAHQYPGTTDYAYHHDALYGYLPFEKTINNTDSYVYTAKEIFFRERSARVTPSLRDVLRP
jgi:hypothetical protein